jgi:gliding motility-associated-like protein
MIRYLTYIILTLSCLQQTTAAALLPAPLLQLVTVDHATASATLSWLQGSSPGVTGYVVYRYRNGEGYAIDTIRDPGILTYTDYSSGALFYSESYVVAAFDSEKNISPLSNALSTIFLETSIDTCNLKIRLDWTGYNPVSNNVTGYEILVSEGGAFETFAVTSPAEKTRTIPVTGFHNSYIFIVKAVLADGQQSFSNRTSISTNLPRPPAWIEISDISVNSADEIELNIKYDPMSEISLYRLERVTEGENNFSVITTLNSTGGTFRYTDPSASATKRHTYRVSAVNSCNMMAVTSPEAGNILLTGDLNDHIITLNWNSYTGWPAGVEKYRVMVSTGGSYAEAVDFAGQDTTYFTSYRDLMYEVSDASVCFFVAANRIGGAADEKSNSNRVCFTATENIFVPTVFSPDGNGLNDFWRPVISFSPDSYYLVIRSRTGGQVYESLNFLEEWDGTHKGRKLPPDIYLWYLRLVTPSGQRIERSGTVAIIYNL